MPAPIVVFAYNRPNHLKQMLNSLQACSLVNDSIIYFYVDGPKTEQDTNVTEVRSLIEACPIGKEKHYIFSPTNQGLKNAVIKGLTTTMQKHTSMIVIEDDLVVSPNFLEYMNQCLEHFEHDKRIGSISGCVSTIKIPQSYKEQVFLYPRTSSWGWATWRDRLAKIDWELTDFEQFRHDSKAQSRFNAIGDDGSVSVFKQALKKLNTWDIQFSYSCFKHNLLTVYPTVSKVKNIGMDNSGTHFNYRSLILNFLFNFNVNKYQFELDTNSTTTLPKQFLEVNAQLLKRYKAKSADSFIKRLYYKWLIYRFNQKAS